MASLGDDLLVTVNKLQDLVFNTIGNDSLDLPQIVSNDNLSWPLTRPSRVVELMTSLGCGWLSIVWQVVRPREHRGTRLLTTR
jgi:hypothetical protein